MKLRAIIIAASLAAIGSGIAYGLFVWPKERAKDTVRALLKDPDSAKFNDVRHNRKTGVSCGFVNAKNSMGGYVGSRAFVVYAAGAMASLEPEAPSPHDQEDEKRLKKSESIRFKELFVGQCLGEKLSPMDLDQCPPEVPGCSWGRE